MSDARTTSTANQGGGHAAAPPGSLARLSIRIHGEYREMPGLRLTVRQAARLFDVAPEVAEAVLQELRCAAILARAADGAFFIDK
ncbi:MAG: hypothetical protein AB7O67_21730 [Vicinamibacterales bacterium]